MALPTIARADSDTARAKQLYTQGLTSYNLGHYDEALTAFEMGYRLRQDPAFLFNIAQCQRMLNRYQDAERTYRAYLRESSSVSDAQRDQIQKLIADMERAQEEQRAKQPPTGTQAPSPTQAPVTAPANASAPTSSGGSTLVASSPPARSERPLVKKPWFWAVVAGGAVVVAGAIVLGVTLGSSTKYPNPSIGVAQGQGL